MRKNLKSEKFNLEIRFVKNCKKKIIRKNIICNEEKLSRKILKFNKSKWKFIKKVKYFIILLKYNNEKILLKNV